MKKIILCTPRSGSTCAVKWLREKSKLLHTSHEEPFLNNNPIKFLESERKKGNEYCYKVHIHQIKNNLDWLCSFYKREEVYILRRRNLWKQYLSHLYQHENGWKFTWVEDPKEINIVPKKANNYKQTASLFFTWQNWINKFDYDTIYYEDIRWDSSHIKFSEYINYEEYFTNIKEIKLYYDVLYNRYQERSWETVK